MSVGSGERQMKVAAVDQDAIADHRVGYPLEKLSIWIQRTGSGKYPARLCPTHQKSAVHRLRNDWERRADQLCEAGGQRLARNLVIGSVAEDFSSERHEPAVRHMVLLEV